MDNKAQQLVNAGLNIGLTDKTLEQLEGLSEQEVAEIAKICGPKDKRLLVFSEWPSDEPPGPGGE